MIWMIGMMKMHMSYILLPVILVPKENGPRLFAVWENWLETDHQMLVTHLD